MSSPELATALEAGFSIDASGLEVPGSVTWTYDVPTTNLDFLADGETLSLTYTVSVTDSANVSVTDDVVLTITGTNDAPTVSAISSTKSEDDSSYVINLLSDANAADPDSSDSSPSPTTAPLALIKTTQPSPSPMAP